MDPESLTGLLDELVAYLEATVEMEKEARAVFPDPSRKDDAPDEESLGTLSNANNIFVLNPKSNWSVDAATAASAPASQHFQYTRCAR